MILREVKEKWHGLWLSMTLKRKISIFISVVFFIIFLLVLFDLWVVKFSLEDIRVILEDNARSSELMVAIEEETNWFADYIKHPNEENEIGLEAACKRTAAAVDKLPYEYKTVGDYRYARTWSIRNSYTNYVIQRDLVLKMTESHPGYIKELYQVYTMQEYLQDYAKLLMRYTLEDGNAVYLEKIPNLKRVPAIVFVLCTILLLGVISIVKIMHQTLITPIVKLAYAAKQITNNHFYVEDVIVENKDELGDLVNTFNNMKFATGEYISALEEKRRMAALLHQEELEKLEVERRLEATHLELLKNQINPHFLFNTLNVLAGMANLEEAETTEKMIKALSFLFRYNLKTHESEALLEQELKIAKDYMYLQQMRFGSRLQYHIDCKVDPQTVIVPTFSFQPLIENAIIHGLSNKEEGGKIYIRIWLEGNMLIFTIMDTGVGISNEALKALRLAFKEGETAHMGIGLGNIYKRVHGMYRNGEVEVFSRKDVGTAIRVKIPQM